MRLRFGGGGHFREGLLVGGELIIGISRYTASSVNKVVVEIQVGRREVD